MNDIELLLAAAKAAGYKLSWGQVGFIGGDFVDCTGMAYVESCQHDVAPAFWDPLNDDGDALRLAVLLDIQIWRRPSGVEAIWKGSVLTKPQTEPLLPDPYAATRRAIVRTAAHIGKSIS